jgi:hypothetical protein
MKAFKAFGELSSHFQTEIAQSQKGGLSYSPQEKKKFENLTCRVGRVTGKKHIFLLLLA